MKKKPKIHPAVRAHFAALGSVSSEKKTTAARANARKRWEAVRAAKTNPK